MGIRRAKVALAVFAAFLVTLVVLADSGHGHQLFALAGRIPAGDKLGHFILFGGLSFLVNLVLRVAALRLGKIVILKGTILVIVVVTLEEFSQLFFRSRTFELLDLLAGALGIWICGRLAGQYLRWKRKRFGTDKLGEVTESPSSRALDGAAPPTYLPRLAARAIPD